MTIFDEMLQRQRLTECESAYDGWHPPLGAQSALYLVPVPTVYAGDDEPWYPESPGERRPQAYELRTADGTATVVHEFSVQPLDPWSWYDAAADTLTQRGYSHLGPLCACDRDSCPARDGGAS
jgi:hypothetical protein